MMGSKLKVIVVNLRQAWETSQRSTKEDWIEWNRRFSLGRWIYEFMVTT
jgi:hypothetical protein